MAEEYKRKWHEHHDPRADDKQYIGTKILDAIEKAAIDTYQDERTLEGWEWANPISVGTAGAIRTVEGVGTVLANTPVVAQGLQAYGKVADVAAGNVGSLVATTGLDPRIGGWAVRLAEAWYGGQAISAASKSKYARAAGKFAKIQADEVGMKASMAMKKKHGKVWKNPKAGVEPDPWFAKDDIGGPKKTYERFQERKAYPKAYGTESPMWMDPSDVPPALGEEARNIARKTDLRMKLEDIIDENPRGTFRDKPIYESTLEENFQPTLLKSRQSFGGKEGYQTKATTLTSQADTKFRGLSVSGIANEKLAESQFRWASKTAKRELQKQTPFEGTLPPEKSKGVKGQKLTNSYRAHHETPLLASAELKEGLKPQYAEELDLYVLEQGVPQGHLVENITIVPHDFHVPILHNKLMDLQLGGKGDLTAIMAKRHPGKQIWELELWERKDVADDLIATVNEAREWTYDFYRTVAALKDKTPTLSNLDIDTIIQAISQSDRFELDEVINKMAGGPNKRTSVAFQFKTKFYKDFEDAVIDEILMGKRGSKFLEDILLKQKNGYQILEAVVFGNQRPAVAIKNIAIKDIDAIQLQLALDTTTPAQMQRIMKAYGKGGKGGIKQ
jgi:hypothetical protein